MKNRFRYSFFILFWVVVASLTCVAWVRFHQMGVPPDTSNILLNPQSSFWFGTDSLGRDFFWRVFFSLKNSLWVGVAVGVISLSLALTFSGLIIFKLKWLDEIVQRFADFFQVLPGFVFVCLASIVWRADSLWQLILIISFFSWMSAYRVLKARIKQLLNEDFITSAVALGGDEAHIFSVHILPHLTPLLKTLFVLQFSSAIIYESSISFIGLGVKSPETSLGILMQEGWRTMSVYPWLMMIPVLLFGLIVLSLRYLIETPVRED